MAVAQSVQLERRRTIRDRVEAMPPLEAVDYLLWQFDLLDEAMTGEVHHPVDDMCARLTPAQRRLMICLYDARGRIRTNGQLHAAILFNGPGNDTAPKIVSVMVSHLRQKLPDDACWIETHKGIGYSLQLEGQTPSK